MERKIESRYEGKTLKEFLKTEVPMSSKMLKYLKFRENGICVNGEACTVRKILHTGDILTLDLADRETPDKLEPVDLPLDILWEDEWLTVPAKPADMPTHPSHDHYRDTVANALAYRYQNDGIPFVFRPINRLDRNTSGLLLIARNKFSAGILTKSMQAGKIHKTYLALLAGTDLPDSGNINFPLHRSAQSVIVREICSPDAPDAEPAQTSYRILARGSDSCLAEVTPVTGRTHQIRVHFASIGHPLLGDDLYGSEDERIPRHALHAWKLSFPHPVTQKTIESVAPIPKDFRDAMQKCFPDEKIEKLLTL